MTLREEGLGESVLIQRAVQRDESAWEALMQLHQQAVFRLAYLFMGDADEAEDVAQETFIRAYHAIKRMDPERPFRPWILSIAANLARNRLRSVKRYLAALQRFARDDPEALEPAPHSPAGDAVGLWQAVRHMRLDDQQVIYLRYFLELSEEEIASTLEIPKGTVKSRLHRALERLRTKWQQEYGEVVSHE